MKKKIISTSLSILFIVSAFSNAEAISPEHTDSPLQNADTLDLLADLHNDIAKHTRHITELEKENNELQQVLESKQAQIIELESQLNEKNARLDELGRKAESEQQIIAENSIEIENLSQQLLSQTDNLSKQVDLNSRLTREKQLMEQQSAEQETTTLELADENQRIKQEQQTYLEENELLKTDLNKLNLEIAKNQNAMEVLYAEIASYQLENTKIKEDIIARDNEIKTITESNKDLQLQLQSSRKLFDDTNKAYNEIQIQLSQSKSDLEQISTDYKNTETEIDRMRIQNSETLEQLNTLKNKLQNSESSNSDLKQTIVELQNEIRILKEESKQE